MQWCSRLSMKGRSGAGAAGCSGGRRGAAGPDFRNHIPGTAWRDRIDQLKRLSAENDYEGGAPVILVVIADNVAGVTDGTLLY